MTEPAWLKAAWAAFGVKERPGAANAIEIVKYFEEAGHEEVTTDSTPWCAAFTGAMLHRVGVRGTGSLRARSYLGWGDALTSPQLGAVTVLTRGSNPNAGHVGFYVGSDERRVFLLGGNQSDAVTVAAFDINRVIGHRWPSGSHPSAVAKPSLPPPQSTGDPVAAAAAPQRSEIFQLALDHVLEMEGGYSNDRYDPGGPTNRGITLEVFAKWRGATVDAASRSRLIEELKRIDDDTVRSIYEARYWGPSDCDNLPEAIAIMHFDAAVNHGVGTAIRLLQASVLVDVDGEIGPLTLAAARGRKMSDTLNRYADLRRRRYRALPHFWRFGRGWLRRVSATLNLALVRDQTLNPAGDKMMDTTVLDNPSGEDFGQLDGKWWGHSKTVWGALITALSTVVPIIGPLIGLDLPADVIREIGEKSLVALQVLGGLFGTLLTIYGRINATQSIARRAISLRL